MSTRKLEARDERTLEVVSSMPWLWGYLLSPDGALPPGGVAEGA
jgi:hypothetical protein